MKRLYYGLGRRKFIEYILFAVFIGMNGIYAAGCRTGTLLNDDGMVSTYICALSAANAFFIINAGTAVGPVKLYRILRTDLLTGMRQTALAAVRYKYPLLGTGIAGKFDHIN